LNNNNYGSVDIYSSINKFINGVSERGNFCCDLNLKCSFMLPTCPLGTPNVYVQCINIGSSKFCASYALSSLPGGICGGILGDIHIVADSGIGLCPSSKIVMSALNSQTSAPNFSWICCNEEKCRVPVNVGISKGDVGSESEREWATTDCNSDQYNLMCFRDNGG
jgi:hypothetical protein